MSEIPVEDLAFLHDQLKRLRQGWSDAEDHVTALKAKLDEETTWRQQLADLSVNQQIEIEQLKTALRHMLEVFEPVARLGAGTPAATEARAALNRQAAS